MLKQGACNYVKSRFNVQAGFGSLTTKRFLYSKKAFTLYGATLKKGFNYDIEIPLTDIHSFKIGSQGFSRSLDIVTTTGYSYKFVPFGFDEWYQKFDEVLKQYGGNKVHKSIFDTGTCENCGGSLYDNMQECLHCGYVNTKATGEISTQPSAATPSPKFCPNCGEQLAEVKHFCPNCGEKLKP